ncbi:hypothetical protein BG011_006334 [Mortierella polycephala]|uniref:GOST seven transmembrane domain-containing protein n=1 Tax=Mortierella polycephala TaxID=41804 RepID=A0A9P6PWD7_9FUNG|nr:hypothetical protein BG011_006334 [Mortierella polycephala]
MKFRTLSSFLVTAALAAVTYARPELVISNDQRGLIYIGSFGFLAGGKLDMNLQDLKVVPYEGDPGDEDRIGFLIQKGPTDAEFVEFEGCTLDDPYFKEEIEQGRSEFKKLDTSKTIFEYHHDIQPGEEEMWTLLFVNCPRSIISFRLKTTEVNPGNNLLSAGDIPLPKVYGGVAVTYFVAGGIWLSMLMKKDTKVFWPHKLIFILAIMIGIQKTFQALKMHYMRTGHDAEGWTVMFYIFAFIKPFLSQKDKKIILVIIPLQILSNIASTISNETAIGSINWSFWTQVFPMIDLVSCVVILVVIIQTQRHLSEAVEAEGKVAENKSKYKLWGSFYLVTVVYIYLTRIMVEFLRVALPYQYVSWLVELLNEGITLGFYATIGWKFRPYANNPYTLIDEDDHDNDDIEAGVNGSETHGLQTMSRREGRTNGDDE